MGQCIANKFHWNTVIVSTFATQTNYSKINKNIHVKYCLKSNGELDSSSCPWTKQVHDECKSSNVPKELTADELLVSS